MTAVLGDGTYTVKGLIETQAFANTSFEINPEGGANSNFFIGERGFRVFVSAEPIPEVSAAPVPEPTPLLLFGSTMAGLLVAARWRQRKQG